MLVIYRLYRFHRQCGMPRQHALRRAVGSVVSDYRTQHRIQPTPRKDIYR